MDADQLIVCESTAAIVLHLRLKSNAPINYGGHHPRPKSLCDTVVAWDIKTPVTSATCRECRTIADLPPWSPP